MADLNLPPLQEAEHNGQKVLSNGQLAVLFNCKRQNVSDIFRRHIKEFEIGADYFFLEKDELYRFKVENGLFEESNLPCTAGDKSACTPVRPFSKTANSAIVFTKSGIFKLLDFVNTKRAKQVCLKLLETYFKAAAQNFKNPPPLNLPKSRKPKIKDSLDLETLKFLIDRAANGNLRDDLIRKAAGISEMPKCVYILEFENVVKIGITQDFQRRAREIITATGDRVKNWCHTDKISSEKARDIETALLEKFDSVKVDGEFFKVEFWAVVEELAKLEDVTDFQNIL